MTGGEGAARSCGIIEEQYITAPLSRGGDGITVYGSDGPVVIRNCTVDLGRWPLDKLDEGISGVDGARAVIRRTRVTRVGKAILWGNGDYPDTDPDAELVLEDCIIRDVGRRAPEAQDGVRVIMRRCVIRNWGIGSRFTVRSFGAWAHDGASIRAEDCVFWQDRFLQAGLWGFVVDLANWIGWSWNRRDWNPLHWLLPGVCRGLTASQKGKVSASRCWANRWWIRLQGHRGPRMPKKEALALMAELEGRLL
ncbi:right-handed parallel beta-helix repeat-containing protein [uncultured Desulfovibrio sp.]|uniref:right-handed parallel beta-helix repeat-containing protein n=1 Tax=uncultured Desulfovibrio sp. TaxID=167968 RepID=UPI00265D15AB|nr:right-handed parallel beta-helix repeat-containing protein [uncultured Desulfovibrio sp.]